MALVGAYEKGGLVWIESDDKPPVAITWRDAILRYKAIMDAEQSITFKRRSPKLQKVLEEVLAAAIESRKKDEKGWEPKKSMSTFIPAKEKDVKSRKTSRIITDF